jgi:hypothetical protein
MKTWRMVLPHKTIGTVLPKRKNCVENDSLNCETPHKFWVPPTGFEPVISTLKG